ncbi:MAG: hypothetical protein P8M20_13365 [Planctomycetaceae bacterium]|nr:hypothetical protein [Planctomycetaceae bacterium]
MKFRYTGPVNVHIANATFASYDCDIFREDDRSIAINRDELCEHRNASTGGSCLIRAKASIGKGMHRDPT